MFLKPRYWATEVLRFHEQSGVIGGASSGPLAALIAWGDSEALATTPVRQSTKQACGPSSLLLTAPIGLLQSSPRPLKLEIVPLLPLLQDLGRKTDSIETATESNASTCAVEDRSNQGGSVKPSLSIAALWQTAFDDANSYSNTTPCPLHQQPRPQERPIGPPPDTMMCFSVSRVPKLFELTRWRSVRMSLVLRSHADPCSTLPSSAPRGQKRSPHSFEG